MSWPLTRQPIFYPQGFHVQSLPMALDPTPIFLETVTVELRILQQALENRLDPGLLRSLSPILTPNKKAYLQHLITVLAQTRLHLQEGCLPLVKTFSAQQARMNP